MFSSCASHSSEQRPLLRHPKRCWWTPRHTVAVMGCLGILLEYCQRVNLSVAIVTMAGATDDDNTTTHACPGTNHYNSTVITPEKGEFQWDKQTQGVLLGAFFWGYATTNIIGGRASEYLGGKMVFGMGIITSSFISLISPVCARANVRVFMACRILLGIVQGVTFPAINTMLATWVLPAERSKFSTIAFSGFQLGTVVGMTVSGWLVSFKFLGGWPSTFYVFGVLGLAWGFAWCVWVYERPEQHPQVSPSDLRDLQEHQSSVKGAQTVAIPWKAVVTSLPFWALVATSLGNDYSFYTLLTELPTYLHDVLHYDLNSYGLLSALPYLLMWLWSLGWAALMDTLTKNGALSILAVRKLSTAVSLYGPMLGLGAMLFVQCDAVVAVVLLCVCGMLNGAVNSGYMCSHQDLAPNFAGTLLGVTNTVGALAGIISPTVTGFLIQGDETVWAWRQVFLISVGLYLCCCTFYLIFTTADVQPWNDPQSIDVASGEDDPDNLTTTTRHLSADGDDKLLHDHC
ncbi:putative inorganic phosphate cotransporter [Homarus americanus]|uniref:putative inorganic phosphate cotransporter n=1 Tax=Homarus americanus TaxID=6706 RepID=UPI001C436AB2|nr:putative inorganic phosphate cotransporter [Homarus americanus]XP_042232184.1 putative inorganic phosphate cotransporter [Homarus americanus]XP_042232185.1 putative inorganic phosphate cotransporter [Homarus americanus]